MRIALAHDWLCGMRGGEMVLDRIAHTLSTRADLDALYLMVDDGRPHSPAIDRLRHITSSIEHIPGAPGKLRRWLLPLYPAAVSSLSRKLARQHARRPIDLLISTSSAAIKGLKPPASIPHLCYCHTPARYLWSQTDEYARGRAGRLRSMGLRLFGDRLRQWDARSSANVTRFLANSSHTAAEIRLRYHREATVLHPPVRTDFFTPDPKMPREPFWLVVGAMEPYKRADLAIQAANQAGHPLVIVGDGSQRPHLQSLAGPTVRFTGRFSDAELRRLYRTASLLLFPQVEDFGITAAEALACGLPVVARRAGGALDMIDDRRTGAFFDQPSVESLLTAIRAAPAAGDAAPDCRRAAERFSSGAFDSGLLREIDLVLTANTPART